jgi:hypothetical protein
MLQPHNIGVGGGDHEPGRGDELVGIGLGAIVGGAKLGMADVADAGDMALGIGFDDDIIELFGRGQAAKGLDIDLIGAMRFGPVQRRVQASGGDLRILARKAARISLALML